MRRIIYILLMAMGMATVMPMVSIFDSSVAVVMAADAKAKAKAQKEKEKAKKAKEKEKAQAAKAKEQAKAKAAKEKEKAQAAKAKEQAKAKAAKAKEQQLKQQAKAKSQAQKPVSQPQRATAANNTKSKQTKAPQLSAAEEKAQYMEQVEAIDKANAKAVAYNTRDITHRLGFWGQAGYSNLFASNIQYTPAVLNAAGDIQTNSIGFQHKDKGFIGGGVGVGYQLRYKRMIMTTGLEFMFYNSVMDLYGEDEGIIYRTYGMQPYATTMRYNYTFSDIHEKMISGYAQIPILFGMEINTKLPFFWQAGLKVGMCVTSNGNLSGSYTTTIDDKELVVDMTDMYKHSLVTDEALDRPSNPLRFGLNVAGSAEFGFFFDPILQIPARIRFSVFADYGFLNTLQFKAAETASFAAQNDLPMQLLNDKDPLAFPVNASFASSAAEKAKVNPFLVGVKVAVWFDLPRHEKPTLEYPKKPTPRMGVYMYDEASSSALGGVAVDITNTATGKRMQKNTNRQGMLQNRFAPGEYRISATKNGYYPSDTILHTVEDFDFDTLRLALKRIPAPIIPMLCMNVYDAETKEPIEATARLTAAKDSVVLYEGQSSDDGFIETPLTEGTYVAHMSAVGYMSKDETLNFVNDTFDIYMQHIKEGIKVKIEHLYFATNKTYILPQSEQAMADLANFLLENASVSIRITGHTDAVGTDEANQILSEGRANAVKADLVKRGVKADRITTEGKGEKEPVASNDTEEGRALNRRVEFIITDAGNEDIEQIF